jgi:hypothetical protein
MSLGPLNLRIGQNCLKNWLNRAGAWLLVKVALSIQAIRAANA